MTDENNAKSLKTTEQGSNDNSDSLPTALTSLIKTNSLLNNIRSLDLKAAQGLNIEAPELISTGKDVSVTGKPRKTTFVPVLVGAIERLTLGYDNNVILIVTPNSKYNTIIYDLVTKLCVGTDILHANCSSRTTKRELDTRLYVGSFDTMLKLVESGKIPAVEVSLVVFPMLNTAMENIDIEEYEALFSAMPKKPQIVITAADQNSQVSEFVKKYMTEQSDITITGQDTMIEHTYSEVGSDLLDKTNALCDIIETSSSDGVLVYCNSDSDTDLVQVIMRKRGFEVERVLSDRAERDDNKNVSEIMRQVAEKEITAVITNDQAIDGIDLDNFDLVINYGIPQEPTLYMNRIGSDASPIKLARVVSLVGPLDFTNFQEIKKSLGATLNQVPLPNKEDAIAAKVTKMATLASKTDYSKDERIGQLIPLIKSNSSCDTIIAMLLHNTLTVIPELKKVREAPARSARGDRYDRGDDNRRDNRRGGGRRERGGWDDRDENRDSRDGRDRRSSSTRSDRGDRGDSRGGDRGGRFSRGGQRGGERNNSDWNDNRGDGEGSDMRGSRDSDMRNQEPPKKDVRFYIGQGSTDGFSKESLSGLMTEHCGLGETDIKRLSIRSKYSFADFAEENAPAIIEKLAGATVKGGSPLFVKKATIISAPRERIERGDNSNGSDGDMDGGSDNGSDNDSSNNSGSSEMSGSDEGTENNGENYQI